MVPGEDEPAISLTKELPELIINLQIISNA